MKSLIFLLLTCFCICTDTLGSAIKNEFLSVPVSYQGRFLPAENYANQWLYHLSHQTTLSDSSHPSSALETLWHLHFFGHSFLDNTPLFWIEHKSTKTLFGLNTQHSQFSYHALLQAINKPDAAPLKKLLVHHFAKAFHSQENSAKRATLEIKTLASNLWLKWQNKKLSVITAPTFFPWHSLSAGMTIAENVSEITLNVAIKETPLVNEIERLLHNLLQFQRLQGYTAETAYSNVFLSLKNQQISPKNLSLQLEQQHPLHNRLLNAGELFKVLPGKFKNGEWYSLHALRIQTYQQKKLQLEPVKNFTIYPDELFEKIRHHYFLLENAVQDNNVDSIRDLTNQLAKYLNLGYSLVAKTPYTEALGKQLKYPSVLQLHAETFYASYPMTFFCILTYAIALALYFLSFILKKLTQLRSIAFSFFAAAFILHSLLLALRCYILGRPPVTNMFETALYVPWIAVVVSIFLWRISKTHAPLIASATASLILLTVLQLNFYASSFENVQAVLDSQYWLLIHVLMVVGSYGLFLLSSILGHLYLGGIVYYKKETTNLRLIAKSILQTLYIGLALLIVGTILGGMWAAQSWGRFWDWDPKESWAFISICIYLLWVHAYRFKKIHSFGIAVGSIIGFLSISFTWYGVNYILGTGLHSYGFGNGGILYYYGYLIAELLFLVASIQTIRLSKDVDKKTPTC